MRGAGWKASEPKPPAERVGRSSCAKPPSLLLGTKNLESLGRATRKAPGSGTSPAAYQRRADGGRGAAHCQRTGRARPAPRWVPAAPRHGPGLCSAASRRRRAGGDTGRAAAGTGRQDAVLRSGAELPERGEAAGRERHGSGDGKPRGAAEARGNQSGFGGSGASLPVPCPAGRFPAPRRGAGSGGARAPPAGGAGGEREAEGSGERRRGGGGQRRGRDSRTLHLQVHLAHLGEPVAQIHGKLLDHCGHTEGGAGERGGGVSRSPPWGRGRRHVAAPSPRLPSAGRARPPGVPVPHTLTLQIVLQIQHGGGRASAKGLLANGGSSLPIWRRRQQHRRLDSAKTTLAADGARLGRAAIGCPRP